MRYRITVGHKDHFGRVRRKMEDSYLARPERAGSSGPRLGSLFLVADGVGGEQGGEIASKVAVNQTAQYFYKDLSENRQAALQMAIKNANEAICKEAAHRNLERIASTLVCALIVDDRLVVAHIGDSRAYLYRQGKVRQLTEDHSWVNEQLKNKAMSEEEARQNPQNSTITRWMGMNNVQPSIQMYSPLMDGDRILLCTDGLYDGLTLDQFEKVLQKYSPQQACEELVDLALRQDGTDNITALVVAIKDENPGEKGTLMEMGDTDPSANLQKEEVWLPLNLDFLEKEVVKEVASPIETSSSNIMLESEGISKQKILQISFQISYDVNSEDELSPEQQKMVHLPDGDCFSCGLRVLEETRMNGYPRRLIIWGKMDGQEIFESSLIGYGSIAPHDLLIDWQKPNHYILFTGHEILCVHPFQPRILIQVTECRYYEPDRHETIPAYSAFMRLNLNILIQLTQEPADQEFEGEVL